MNNTEIILIIAATATILFGLPIWGAFALNKRLHRLHPESLPFAWGYWLAITCFLVPLYAAGSLDQSTEESIKSFVFLVSLIIFTPLGVFALRRKRWAFVTLTILLLNPIIWIINIFYLKTRWDELS